MTKSIYKTLFILIAILCLCLTNIGRSSAQTISYIIPDIGSSGQNTYIEIIGPHNQDNNFGTDGIYSNNIGDAVRVICQNSSDESKVKIGPVVVSWNGKMISTQVFVMPVVTPNSSNWQLLSSAYKIPFQVVINNTAFSNADTFYIVQPQAAIISSGAITLGTGAGGIRSRRGAMIFDSLVLQNGANFTVSTTDCDPATIGNQGFLPIHVISRGRIFIDNGASISVAAPGGQNPDGAAGGGGGGTESWTNNSCCHGNRAGDGFTGGGAERAACSEIPGVGSGAVNSCVGCGGNSLNGVLGGAGGAGCADAQDGAGGTGHPFGSSGSNGSGPGGYGGGTGWSFSGGGFASDGIGITAGTEGKANGNSEITPFSGGSGASGGVAGPGTSSGGGGGGGGGLSLHAYYSSVLLSSGQVNSDGGIGVLGAGGYRGGGGGSAGSVMLSGKLNSQGIGTISVSGGAGGVGGGGSGGAGGAGRVRIDGPFTTSPSISPVPGVNSSSSYNGPSTDTICYVGRSFNLTGTGNGQTIRIYIKPITKPWQLAATVSSYGTAWTQNLILPCPDTLFLLAVAQAVPSPSITQYTAEPQWVFSQAAANILIVKNALKARAGADAVICPSTCKIIGGAPSAVGGVPPYTYLWSPNTGLNDSLIANPTACFRNNTTYALTVRDSSGCFITDSVNVTMYPLPIAKYGFKNVCLHQPMNFTDSSTVSTGTIASWSWNFGDGAPLVTVQNPSHTYAAYGTYSVSLIVATNNGCKDTITQNVVVHPLPVAGFVTANVCDRNAVQFTDSSTIVSPDFMQTWSWNFGDGTPVYNNPTASHLYATSGSYNVQLLVVTDFGCKDSLTKISIVHPNPISNFKNMNVCDGTSMPFTDTSTTALGTINLWSWNFGDGSPLITSQNSSHLYSSAGRDSTTLIIKNSFGCADTITKSVQVYFNPIASFTHADVCFGDTIHFTNTSSVDPSTSIASYLWSFGDGSTNSSLKNPNHYYSSHGTYTVTLVTTTIDGCSEASTVQVKTYDAPTSAFTFSNTCLFDSALFTNTSVNPTMGTIANWSWDFGDASPVNTTIWSPHHIYSSAGTYQVTLITYSSSLGCPDTVKHSITIFPMPHANYGFMNVCLNQPIHFTDSSTVSSGAITVWSWAFGDGSTLNSNQNPIYTYASAGNYTVSLIATTNNGCKDTIIKNATIHPLPHALFNTTNICYGNSAAFTDLSSISPPDIIQSWSLNFGDGTPLSSDPDTSHAYSAIGSYTSQLLTVSSFGCKDSIVSTNVVNPNPVASFTANDTIGCEPLCVSFQSTSSVVTGVNTHWGWTFGDGSPTIDSQNLVHCYHNDSVYAPNFFTVTLIVTSDSGCTNIKSKTNYITVYPAPNTVFTVQPKTATIVNPVISITDLSTGANFWHWNFGDTTTSIIANTLSHTYADTGTYIITLITSTQYNCADTAYETVIIEPDFIFYIPNAFTPNDDGVNDTFTGKGIFIKQFEMSIFDRWGNLIYQTNDINKPWDGKANHGSDIAQRDVYVYLVKVLDFKNQNHNYKGTVTLTR
jgi:gliding motility-associated-like protein